MTNMLFDIFIASLLGMAIIFCWRLNVRLQSMRKMGADLSPFMKNLASYLHHISGTIDKLKYIADTSHRGLNEQIPAATALKDDFDILLEHSEKMARRLDEVIENAQQMDRQLQHTLTLVEKSRHMDDIRCRNTMNTHLTDRISTASSSCETEPQQPESPTIKNVEWEEMGAYSDTPIVPPTAQAHQENQYDHPYKASSRHTSTFNEHLKNDTSFERRGRNPFTMGDFDNHETDQTIMGKRISPYTEPSTAYRTDGIMNKLKGLR
jgi:hypothetical protein